MLLSPLSRLVQQHSLAWFSSVVMLSIPFCWFDPVVAADHVGWPDKSGPTFNGHVPAAEARGLPTHWNEANGQNIAWKIPLEDHGLSTPVIGHGRLWFTAATSDGHRQFVVCVDEQSGKILHRRLLFENPQPEPLYNAINTYASPSCVLEDDALYVHFGSYGTARLNPETAEVVWQRRDFPCRHFRGPGSSPAIHGNVLVLTFDGVDQQYIAAIDKRTGENLWRVGRSVDYKDLNAEGKPKADGDLRKAYHTPSFVEVDGRVQVVSIGSRGGYGYDLLTGKEIWMFEHPDFNASARVMFQPGFVIINSGSNLFKFRLDGTTRGNITQSHLIWNRKKGNSKLSSPLLVDGRIYMVTDNGVVFVADAETGEDAWTARLGGTFVASPIYANGLIYAVNEDGIGCVFRAGAEYDEVAKNELAEGMRSSLAVAGGALYLRTFGHLYKIAQPQKDTAER